MWSEEVSRKLREERGVEWCAQMMKGRLPFIGSRGGRGGAGQLIMETTLRAAKGQGDVIEL
jgi:hypothetical protein